MLTLGQLVPRDFSLARNIISTSPSNLRWKELRERETWRLVDKTLIRLGIARDSSLRSSLVINAREICNLESSDPTSHPVCSEHQSSLRNSRQKLANIIDRPQGLRQIGRLCQFAFGAPFGFSLAPRIGWIDTSNKLEAAQANTTNQACIVRLVSSPLFINILAAAAWHVDKYPTWLADFHQKVETVYLPEITEQICNFASKTRIPLTTAQICERLQHLSVEVAAPGHGLTKERLLGQYHMEEHLVLLAFGKVFEEYERFVMAHELFHALSGRALRLKTPNARDKDAVLIAVENDYAQVTMERHGIGGKGINPPFDWLNEATVDLLTVGMLGERYFSFLYEAEKLILNELIRRGVPWKLFLDALFDEPATVSQAKDFSATTRLLTRCRQVLGTARMRRLDLTVRRNGAKSALKLLDLKVPQESGTQGYL